jgi:hypothetical protein
LELCALIASKEEISEADLSAICSVFCNVAANHSSTYRETVLSILSRVRNSTALGADNRSTRDVLVDIAMAFVCSMLGTDGSGLIERCLIAPVVRLVVYALFKIIAQSGAIKTSAISREICFKNAENIIGQYVKFNDQLCEIVQKQIDLVQERRKQSVSSVNEIIQRVHCVNCIPAPSMLRWVPFYKWCGMGPEGQRQALLNSLFELKNVLIQLGAEVKDSTLTSIPPASLWGFPKLLYVYGIGKGMGLANTLEAMGIAQRAEE